MKQFVTYETLEAMGRLQENRYRWPMARGCEGRTVPAGERCSCTPLPAVSTLPARSSKAPGPRALSAVPQCDERSLRFVAWNSSADREHNANRLLRLPTIKERCMISPVSRQKEIPDKDTNSRLKGRPAMRTSQPKGRIMWVVCLVVFSLCCATAAPQQDQATLYFI